MPALILLLALVLPALSVSPAGAEEGNSLQNERRLFQTALDALEKEQVDSARAALSELDGYPLKPYLEYRLLLAQLPSAPAEQVQRFLEHHADAHFSATLRTRWLHELARRNAWEAVRDLIREDETSIELRCLAITAQLRTGQAGGIVNRAGELWMSGRNRPTTCEPAFAMLDTIGWITPERLRQRIRLAFDEDNPALAATLARQLGGEAPKRVEAWKRAVEAPDTFLKKDADAPNDSWRADMRVDAVRKLARKDPDQAHPAWLRLRTRYAFTPEQIGEAEREIALRAAWRMDPRASGWLRAVPRAGENEELRAWKVRAALREQDWPHVITAIEAMPAAEREREEWRYWLARAREALGRKETAQALYAELARQGSGYHALLAADRLNLPYAFATNPPLTIDTRRLDALTLRPAIRRAREFRALGMIDEARREWNAALDGMDGPTLGHAARLADHWGWHDRAQVAMGRALRAGAPDLPEVRFPLPWREDVLRAASERELDPHWVYGVIRQESLFMHEVRSRVGAVGLMQLMPATATWMGGKLGRKIDPAQLTDVALNVDLGTAYLGHVRDNFDGHQAMATAAYNAGPGRVRQWQPRESALPADAWIDSIPFDETRNYVQSVLAYTTVFDWRIDGEMIRLSERLPPVPPRQP